MPVLSANGETIHYVKEGAGPAVALIHSLGANAQMWHGVIEVLKDRCTLIACDARGHGQSSAGGECTVASAAQDFKATLDHLEISECALVGISTGVPVALTFAAQWPVRALVLAGGHAAPVEGATQRVEATAEAIAYVSMEEFGTQYAAETLLPSTSLDVQDELARAIAKVNPKVYIQLMRSAVLGDFTALLPSIRAPVLVLAGDDDAGAPAARALAAGIAGATLETLPASGHLACLDNPAAFAAAVERFMSALR